MYIINNWQDLTNLPDARPDRQELLPHFQALWQAIRQALQSEVKDTEFNLTDFGSILLLNRQDELLDPIQPGETLSEVWPDFVRCVDLPSGEVCYEIGLLQNPHLSLVYVFADLL